MVLYASRIWVDVAGAAVKFLWPSCGEIAQFPLGWMAHPRCDPSSRHRLTTGRQAGPHRHTPLFEYVLYCT